MHPCPQSSIKVRLIWAFQTQDGIVRRAYVNPEISSAAFGILRCRWQVDSTSCRKPLTMLSTIRLAKKLWRGLNQGTFLIRFNSILVTNRRLHEFVERGNGVFWKSTRGTTALTACFRDFVPNG